MKTKRVDDLSKNILELLTTFSDEINEITALNNELLKDTSFNTNEDFVSYIHYFNLGRYYHFRCMGFMECLVMTRCYNVESLCYWKNGLVMPAYNYITMSLQYEDKLNSDTELATNDVLGSLNKEIEKLKQTAMKIMSEIKLYKLPC